MKVRYSYKIEDFEEICEVADNLSPRRRRIRFGLVFVGILLFLVPFLTSSGPSQPDKFLLGMSPFGVVLIVCGLRNPRRVARKYYGPEVDGREFEVTIDEGGITTTSSTARTEFQWTAFTRVIEGPNAVALVERTVMYLFPKRAFTSEQWGEFLTRLREHVPVWDANTRSVRLL